MRELVRAPQTWAPVQGLPRVLAGCERLHPLRRLQAGRGDAGIGALRAGKEIGMDGIDVRKIVAGALLRMGADGLRNGARGCFCAAGNLMPCCNPCGGCVAVKAVYCGNCGETAYVAFSESWQKPAM